MPNAAKDVHKKAGDSFGQEIDQNSNAQKAAEISRNKNVSANSGKRNGPKDRRK